MLGPVAVTLARTAVQPLNGAIGKALIEIGKALGKAVVAGIGMELARAASGHVKRIASPKDKKGASAGTVDEKHAGEELDDDDELTAMRRENARLRAELAAMRRERTAVPAASSDDDSARVAVAVDVVGDFPGELD